MPTLGTRATHFIKGGPDHTVQYPLAMGTVHDHERVHFVPGERGGELHSVDIGEGRQDSTRLLLSRIVGMCLWGGGGGGGGGLMMDIL